MESGEIRTLAEIGDSPHYVPTGHLLYSQTGRLMGVPFDLEHMEITGSPVPIIDDVGLADFGTAEDGTLVYATSRAFVPNSRLVWVDRQGRESPLMDTPRQYIEPRVSPDGSRLAVTLGGGPEYDIWIHEFDRGTLSRLTFADANDSLPVWTPDGQNITYCSNSSGVWSIYSVPSDGSGEPTLLTNDENTPTASSWSPDGQFLAITLTRPGTGVDVGIVSKDEEGKIEIFLGTPFDELHPVFSPNGRWLAYTSDESGRPEVYVRSFPGPGRKWQISTEGGMYPLWAPNGRELFYRNGNKMMAVSLTGDSDLRPDVPVTLFESQYHMLPLSGANLRSYDVSRDGQRFVMIKPIEEESRPTQVHVVLNWFEELKARVPTE
jgi:serine/threonine-protein kinase